MKMPVYWGCKIPTSQYAYEISVRQVLPHFNVELGDLEKTSCCGGPVRSVKTDASLYLSARNLALAYKTGIKDLLVPCNECHFMLSETKHRMKQDPAMNKHISKFLREEELEYSPDIKIWHIIDLFHDLIGIDTIKEKLKKPLKGFKFAVHPGCQIIRPSEIVRVDDSENPKKLDKLVNALGAETIDYSEKLDCCGAALLYSHEDASLSLAGTKLKALQNYDIDGVVDSCPYCHMMYDLKQKDATATVGSKGTLPVFYYTQLLGVALKLKPDIIGLHLNQSFEHKKFILE